jgi:DNA repair photolyase
MNKTGTREWSEHSFNCVKGCAHGCLYCYARDNRFNSKRGADWTNEELTLPKVRKFPGVVMFPTQHDFTAKTTAHCQTYLFDLLDKGNNVLVVTKSGLDTVEKIIAVLKRFPREQSEIRFTLSQFSVEIGEFWEPGAPDIKKRMAGLFWANGQGVRTSVSCEPWLDTNAALYALVEAVSHHVTETIWIGHANKLRKRTGWAYSPRTTVDAEQREALDAAITIIEARQTKQESQKVYDALKGNPMVRWKDSYQKMLMIDSHGDLL